MPRYKNFKSQHFERCCSFTILSMSSMSKATLNFHNRCKTVHPYAGVSFHLPTHLPLTLVPGGPGRPCLRMAAASSVVGRTLAVSRSHTVHCTPLISPWTCRLEIFKFWQKIFQTSQWYLHIFGYKSFFVETKIWSSSQVYCLMFVF